MIICDLCFTENHQANRDNGRPSLEGMAKGGMLVNRVGSSTWEGLATCEGHLGATVEMLLIRHDVQPGKNLAINIEKLPCP